MYIIILCLSFIYPFNLLIILCWFANFLNDSRTSVFLLCPKTYSLKK